MGRATSKPTRKKKPTGRSKSSSDQNRRKGAGSPGLPQPEGSSYDTGGKPAAADPAPDPRYAALAFFDPLAPKLAVVEPVALMGPALVWPRDGEQCGSCGVVVDMRLKLPHMWWCTWWESPEGKVHELPF